MAAITITPNPPASTVKTSLGTTQQQVNLPPGTKSIMLYGSHAALLQFSGTDGAAVDADIAVHIPATTWTRFYVPPTASRAIFVAAHSGTITLSIVAE
jgi:hypothetical protein